MHHARALGVYISVYVHAYMHIYPFKYVCISIQQQLLQLQLLVLLPPLVQLLLVLHQKLLVLKKVRVPESYERSGVDEHTHGERFHSPTKAYGPGYPGASESWFSLQV